MPHLDRYEGLLQQRDCELVLTTMLRDPVQRTLSAMAYNLRPQERSQASLPQFWETRFAKDPKYDNGQVRYVLNNLLTGFAEVEPLPFPLRGAKAERGVQ